MGRECFEQLKRTQDGDIWLKNEADRGIQVYEQDEECGSLWIDEGEHIVGADGFVVPRTASEFFVRYPDYVRTVVFQQVHRRIGWATYSVDIYEDIISDLHVMISDLSPRRQGYQYGKRDMIQLFDPLRMHGAKKGMFFSFVNRIVCSQFATLMFQGVMKDRLLRCESLDAPPPPDELSGAPGGYIYDVPVDPWVAEDTEIEAKRLLRNILREVPASEVDEVEALLREYSDVTSPTAVARTLNVQKRDVLKTLAKVRNLDCVQEAMLETVGHIF